MTRRTRRGDAARLLREREALATPIACPRPECGAPLDPQDEVERFNPTTGVRAIVRAAFCTACEYVHEF